MPDRNEKRADLLISLLTHKEKIKFSKWLAFSADGSQKELIPLYELMRSGKSDQKIWQHLFPKKEYNDALLRRRKNKLVDHLVNYLAYRHLYKSEALRYQHILQELTDRRSVLIPQIKKKAVNSLQKQSERNREYFQALYHYERADFNHRVSINSLRQNHDANRVTEAFELWQLHEKVGVMLSNLNYTQIFGQEIPQHLPEASLELAAMVPKEKAPLLFIYVNLYRFLEGDTDQVETLNKHIQELNPFLSRRDKHTIYLLLKNHLIRQQNQHRTHKNVTQVLELDEWALREKLVYIGQYIPAAWLNSFIISLCFVGKISEAEAHHQTLIPELAPEEQAYTRNYQEILLAFHRKNFSEVCIKCKDYVSPNPRINLNIRMYWIKSRFELGERDSLDPAIRALKSYIKHQKTVSNNNKTLLIMRLRVLRKLSMCYQKEEFEALRTNLLSGRAFSDRGWYLEKIAEALGESPIA